MVWILIDNTYGNAFAACGFTREVVEEALAVLMETDKMYDVHCSYTIKRVENIGNGYPKYFEEKTVES